MAPSLRKFVLTAHVTVSVGWLGSVVAYIALAIAGLASRDAQMVRAAYLSLEVIGWFVIVPFSLATVLTGLVQSLGTEWGLFRHYWIAVKFVLTVVATLILLRHMQVVSGMARLAADTTWSIADSHPQRVAMLVHAVGGLLVLLTATVLSVYKPWGLTSHGKRKQQERRQASPPVLSERPLVDAASNPVSNGAPTSRWTKIVGVHAVILVLLFVVLHLSGGHVGHH